VLEGKETMFDHFEVKDMSQAESDGYMILRTGHGRMVGSGQLGGRLLRGICSWAF
jgi:hypothetical protein